MTDNERERLSLYESLTDEEAAAMDDSDIADYESLKRMQTAQASQNEPPPGIAERVTGAIFPRTTQAAKRGEEYPIGSVILDAASLPGRTIAAGLRAVGGAEDVGYKGLGPTFAERIGATSSDAQGLGARVGEELLIDPWTVLIPGAGGVAARVARPLVRMAEAANVFGSGTSGAMKAQGAVEAARVAGEGAAGGYSGGDGFSPFSAVATAAPGAAMGAKAAADVPANLQLAQYTKPYVVRETMNEIKFRPTRKMANKQLSDVEAIESALFLADRYGPAPMQAATEQSVSPWIDINNALRQKITNIGEAQAASRGAPEFENRVVGMGVLKDYAQAPETRYKELEIPVPRYEKQVKSAQEPFRAIYDRISMLKTGKSVSKKDAKALYNELAKNSEGALSPVEGDITINQLIDLKRQINKEAAELGKYRTPTEKQTYKALAYDEAYDIINESIRGALPETEATKAYLEAEKAFASNLPVRDALRERVYGELESKKAGEQTEIGRLARLLRRDVPGAIGDAMPPKITAGNAYRLYQEAPKTTAKAARKLSEGSGAMATRPISSVAPRFLYNRYLQKREGEQ